MPLTQHPLRQVHLADVHGVQLGQQDLRQVYSLRVMVLYALSSLPVQSLWEQRGLCVTPRAIPLNPAATQDSKSQRACSCCVIAES